MEDLLKILFVIGAFIVWIVQSVAQAKKRASQEFDQALDEIEDEEEDLVKPQAPLPPRAPAPQKPARPMPQGAPTWKELQKQLEQVLGQPPTKPSPQSTAPIPIPRPRETQREQPQGESRPGFDMPTRQESRAPRPAPQPQSTPRSTPQLPPRPAVVVRSTTSREAAPRTAPAVAPPVASIPGRRYRRGKFPNFHPNPIANAVLLSEILKPYSRGSLGWQDREWR